MVSSSRSSPTGPLSASRPTRAGPEIAAVRPHGRLSRPVITPTHHTTQHTHLCFTQSQTRACRSQGSFTALARLLGEVTWPLDPGDRAACLLACQGHGHGFPSCTCWMTFCLLSHSSTALLLFAWPVPTRHHTLLNTYWPLLACPSLIAAVCGLWLSVCLSLGQAPAAVVVIA